MDIPACVFYIATVCMCVKKRGEQQQKKKDDRKDGEENKGDKDDRKGSSIIKSVWKQPHFGVSKSCKIKQSSYGSLSLQQISVNCSLVFWR